jgi:hypothetical protein
MIKNMEFFKKRQLQNGRHSAMSVNLPPSSAMSPAAAAAVAAEFEALLMNMNQLRTVNYSQSA